MAENCAPDFFEMSLCKDCENMMSRLIKPVDPEDFGMTEEEMEAEEIELIEQNICLVVNMDIMYTVLACNKYKPASTEKSLFLGKKPLF